MSNVFQCVGRGLAKFFDGLSGRNRKGMRNRLIIAVSLSVIAILVDSYLVYTNYEYLPSHIGTYYNWDYVATVTKPKSVFWNYEMQRFVVLAVMVCAGWLTYSRDKASPVRFRVFTLLSEIANLIILTGVGISVIMLAISRGDSTKTVSDNVEFSVMYVWLTILLLEFFFDIRFLKQNKAE
ncbi:MAG: hypothetical protein MJY71_04835 [Bacteroidaceae bacterium]|nr:hypothetical protein [Bacteroidaceae bacterium]